jgi:hypothetical protein
MKYGRSFSLCIMDILEGKVKESEVGFLVVSTRIRNDQEYNQCVNLYSETYWKTNPKEGKAIARRLWDSGKIVQPRLENNNVCQALYDFGVWTDSDVEVFKSLVEN